MRWIKAMISWNERAKVHLVKVDNPELLRGDAITACGRKIAANSIYSTDWDVDCKKCLKLYRSIMEGGK